MTASTDLSYLRFTHSPDALHILYICVMIIILYIHSIFVSFMDFHSLKLHIYFQYE